MLAWVGGRLLQWQWMWVLSYFSLGKRIHAPNFSYHGKFLIHFTVLKGSINSYLLRTGKVSMTKMFSKCSAREQSTLKVTIDHLQVAHLRQASVSKHYKAECEVIDTKVIIYSNANINHFHQKGFKLSQRAKKVVSDSPGLVDFAIGLVIFVQGKCCFLGKFKLQKDYNQSCWSKRVWGLVEMTCELVHASCCLPEWQAVRLTFFAPWLNPRFESENYWNLEMAH